MSTDHSIIRKRAGVYRRMSTDDQESSPERQSSLVDPYCQRKGYVVVGVYQDLGIAGDEFEKRTDFQRLLADARAGKLDVIVSDEPSRIARLEPDEFFAKVAYPLRVSKVTIDTASGGALGWDLPSWIMHLLNAEKSVDEVKKLSRRVLSGMALAARAGRPMCGVAPYGLKVEYETTHEPGKPPSVRPLRYVPDGEKAAAVRWMFLRYAHAEVSLAQIALELDRQQVPPPGRMGRRRHAVARWSRNAVRAILRNLKYTGAAVWNRSTVGKHYRLADGEAVQRQTDGPRWTKGANDKGDWIVVPDAHEALVSQEVFDLVQAKLTAQQAGRRTVPAGGHLLSGLLVCGHCGRTLHAATQKGLVYYRCCKNDTSDKGVCGYGGVRESLVLSVVLAKLRERFTGAGEQAVKRELLRQIEAERGPVDLPSVRKRLKELNAWIDQGNTNLALLPPDRIAGVVEKIRAWEEERNRLARQTKEADELPTVARQVEEELAGIRAVVEDMEAAQAEGDRAALREAIVRLVSRVSVRWERRLIRTYTRHTVAGGTIYVRPGPAGPDSNSRGANQCQPCWPEKAGKRR